MKIFKLFPLACAALMMSACSSDDGNGSENPNIASEAQYLAVNIVNVGTTPTRGSSADPNYADGTDAENKINKVRFYFFNADGSPYKLVDTSGETDGGTGVNWLEQKTTTPITEGSTGSVDKILKTVLVIKGSTAAAPAKMVTVINPGTLTTTTIKSDGVVTLSELCDGLNDTKFYAPTAGSISDFVMTNSAYLEAGRKVCPSLVSGHVETTETGATNNPVDIYVERVAAKVSTELTKDNFEVGSADNWGDGLYKTKTPVYTYGANTQIYAVIEGWGVADENGKAMVVKQISDSWTNDNIGINPWNTADYHRCFWESMMPNANATGTSIYSNVNHAFNYYKANIKTGIKYTLPNTAADANEYSDKNENNMTKFLVAATLKYKGADDKWHNAEVCKYRGVEYLGINNLKEAVATAYNKYYKKVGTDYKELEAADIDFSTTRTSTTTTLKDYQVVPTLAKTVTEVYEKTSTGYNEVTAKAKEAIEEFPADVRKDGKVYYYIPINHLGSVGSVAECGVVRNHWYKVTLNSINGLGTPVYDETKIIDPTTPKDLATYLAARVNVLQWRVVTQTVNFGN